MAIVPDSAEVVAFVTFSAVVAGTPGPSNTLLTIVGATVGIRRGPAALRGQVTGMARRRCPGPSGRLRGSVGTDLPA